ncbi:MAG: BON domain-containing protein [Alcaligenaceae bacterium]|nr:BON domain-containing protein [Alcaligenaceae bacterium]
MLSTSLSRTNKVKLSKKLNSRQLLIAGLLASSTVLSACVPLMVGGVATGVATVVSDRRPASMQANDKKISVYAEHKAAGAVPTNTSRVNATTFNHRVLLTGEVASEEHKRIVEQEVREIDDVNEVVNQLKIGPIANFSTRSNDTWISTKVKTDLLATSGAPSGTILTTTSQGIVYLMGQVTAQEADVAANAAAGVAGVLGVVKVFDIASSTARISTSPKASSTTSSSSANTSEASGGGTQTFPLAN